MMVNEGASADDFAERTVTSHEILHSYFLLYMGQMKENMLGWMKVCSALPYKIQKS
jgi:hypothetical protein